MKSPRRGRGPGGHAHSVLTPSGTLQNLFLVHNHIKVADFGLAKDMEAGRDRVTITGGVTPYSIATVAIGESVTAVNDAPGTVDDAATTAEDTARPASEAP